MPSSSPPQCPNDGGCNGGTPQPSSPPPYSLARAVGALGAVHQRRRLWVEWNRPAGRPHTFPFAVQWPVMGPSQASSPSSSLQIGALELFLGRRQRQRQRRQRRRWRVPKCTEDWDKPASNLHEGITLHTPSPLIEVS